MRSQASIIRLATVIVLAAAFLIACQTPLSLADSNMSWFAKLEAGHRTARKNLIFTGARGRDRQRVIKSYRHVVQGGAVAFTYIVTRMDGSQETLRLAEMSNQPLDHMFYGARLDVLITRLSEDADQPIVVRGFLHTRQEGEPGFP